MKLSVDETIGPETNFTMRYWERITWDVNETSASVRANISIKAKEKGNTTFPVTAYYIIFNPWNKLEDQYESFICCTPALNKTEGCTVGQIRRPDRLIDVTHIQNINITLDPQNYTYTELLNKTGTFVVMLSVCSSLEVVVKGEFAWNSTHGYIFPEEYPLILISQILAGFYFVVLLVFGGLSLYHRANLLYIHYGIIGTLLLSISNQCLWYYYYHIMNTTGQWTLTFLGFVVLVQIITQIARLVLMLMLSVGLGTNVALLKTARVVDYDVINLDGFGDEEEDKDGVEPYTSSSVNSSASTPSSFLCWKSQPTPPSCDKPLVIRLVIFCILTFIFQYVDAMQSAAQVYSPAYLLAKTTSVFVTGVTILLTLIFYVWVVLNIVNTFRFLKGHPIQLRDYKLFLAVLVIAFLLGVGTMGYKVYSKIMEGNLDTDVEQWNSVWENRLLWSLVTAFLLFSIAAIWNPHRNSSFNRSTHVA